MIKLKLVNATNLKSALGKDATMALKLYDGYELDELEELLRVELQKASDREILLTKMYTELANYNLQKSLLEPHENID